MKEPKFNVTMNEYLPLRDVVFNTLRQAILRGELKPGERLMEIQLANKLGVSRTPIREALRKLELEGLVNMVPRKGAEVADITEKSLRDVLEVRKALEELSVQLACEKITEEEIEELKRVAERFKDTLNDQDYITYIYLDQGNLKELFTSDSSSANASAGTTIAQLSDFQISESRPGFYSFELKDSEGNKETFYLHQNSVSKEPS